MSLTPDQRVHTALAKIRWEKELSRYGYERNRMSPELAEALRNEIRTALEAGGGSFDINVARRVYDLAIAARDMCIAATGSVKEAIDQIKDTNGPMETLDAADTPESQMQASESFGARLFRELMATLPMLQGSRGEDPKRLVHALAEARRNGMHDVAEQLEVKLFGRTLSGSRPVIAEEIEVVEGSYEQGYADGRSGALPMSTESAYHEGFLKGTEAKFLDKKTPANTRTGDHSAAIARDVRLGLTSLEIRAEIIAKVGMMATARTPEMQARYDAALERECPGVIAVEGGSFSHGFYEALAGLGMSRDDEEYRRGHAYGEAHPGEPVPYRVAQAVGDLLQGASPSNGAAL